jgi:hypothetical protein
VSPLKNYLDQLLVALFDFDTGLFNIKVNPVYYTPLFDYNIAHLAELISQRRYAFDNLLNFFRLVVVDLLYRVLLELACLLVKIIGPSIHIR